MTLHTFVDNSNVLIEGRRLSEAKRKGKPRGPYVDETYQIDWGKFLYLLKEKDSRRLSDVPVLYGSRPPPDDSVWERIRSDGFKVELFERNIRNQEKGVDMTMGMDIMERMMTVTPPTTIIIAAGDADYIPVIERAKSRKWSVEVWFWGNAAADVKKAASRFIDLDKHLDYLRLGGGVALP